MDAYANHLDTVETHLLQAGAPPHAPPATAGMQLSDPVLLDSARSAACAWTDGSKGGGKSHVMGRDMRQQSG
jgi:hypothetical protein